MEEFKFKKPFHYDEHGMAWPDDLWQAKEAQRIIGERKQHEQERKQKEVADKMLIRVTSFGVLVTFIVGFSGFWAAYEAHKTRIDDERPFIGVDAVPIQPGSLMFDKLQIESGDLFPIATTLVLSGKSPAIHIDVQCVTREESPKLSWKMTPSTELHFALLMPGRATDIGCPMIFQKNRDNSDSFIQFGVVTYQDTNDTKYTTPFCHALISNKQFLHVAVCSSDYDLPKLK